MVNRLTGKIKKFRKLLTERKLTKDLSPDELELIDRIKLKNLTYLSKSSLASIVYTINSLKKAGKEGLLVEAGCALGGSSILIANKKPKQSNFFIYDVFGMIPAPTEEDTKDVHERYKIIEEGKSTGIGQDLYYGYEENLYDKVISNLNDFGIIPEEQNVKLIKGLVQETMNISQPVCFAHIDVDWYDPVMTCLEQIWPNLIVGGSIILDDYNVWGGCRKATDEFFGKLSGQYKMDDSFGSMKVTKVN